MNNLETQLKNMFDVRGLQVREHQMRNILDYTNPKKPHVIAAGTGTGKTILMAARFELYYMTGLLKKNDINVVFAGDKTILNDNFYNQFNFFFKDYSASFTYRKVTNFEELTRAIKDKVNVIIGIPQLLGRYDELFNGCKIKWVVVDEAHRWYFAKFLPQTINRLNPKYQCLLTGTPFKFNRNREDYIIDYTPISHVYPKYVSNAHIQVLHSSIALHREDYVGLLDNLKKRKSINHSDMNETFELLIKQMVKILKVRKKDSPNFNKLTNQVMSVFGKLEKTVIFTHGIAECDYYYELLRKHGVSVLRSHSKIKELPQDTFDDFKNEELDYKVMVTVDRGKEGFDFPDLYNIIDLTYTQNFEVLMQMIGRILRISKTDTPKVFYKVAPRGLSEYFTLLMNHMLQLFDIHWYKEFDGTNAIRIPSPTPPNGARNVGGSRGPRDDDEDFNLIDIERLGMNSISFMSKNVWHKDSDPLSVVSLTTLGDVMKKYEMWNPKEFKSFHEAKEWVRNLNLNNKLEWDEYIKRDDFPNDIPKTPWCVYGDLYQGLGDWLGTGRIASKLKVYKPFVEAREWVRSLEFKSTKEWNEYVRNNKLPTDIPKAPKIVYGEKFIGFPDWLGYLPKRGKNKKYRSFEEARKWVRDLNFKNEMEWREYKKRDDFPNDIPKQPQNTTQYKNKWKGMGDWLGTFNSKNREWLSFEEAKKYMKPFNLKNEREWRGWKKQRPKNIPSQPEVKYKNQWKGFKDFLGN
jgi:superfamily II DNA or RNA helicase